MRQWETIWEWWWVVISVGFCEEWWEGARQVETAGDSNYLEFIWHSLWLGYKIIHKILITTLQKNPIMCIFTLLFLTYNGKDIF